MQATGDTDGEQLDVSALSVTAAQSKIRGPKMIAFDERDDMDSYLHRFERYADLQGWKGTYGPCIYLRYLKERL